MSSAQPDNRKLLPRAPSAWFAFWRLQCYDEIALSFSRKPRPPPATLDFPRKRASRESGDECVWAIPVPRKSAMTCCARTVQRTMRVVGACSPAEAAGPGHGYDVDRACAPWRQCHASFAQMEADLRQALQSSTHHEPLAFVFSLPTRLPLAAFPWGPAMACRFPSRQCSVLRAEALEASWRPQRRPAG